MKMTAFKLQDIAKEAVDLATSGGDLNEAIAKIASREEMNPTQIQRLVETANHNAYDRTYKTAKDKRFAFKLASRDEVLALLKQTSGEEKTASADEDFFALRRAETFQKEAEVVSPVINHYRSMGGWEAMRKGLTEELTHALHKLSSYRADVQLKISALDLQLGESMKKLANELRRLMLEDHLDYGTLYKAAAGGTFEPLRPIVQAIFKKLASQLSATTKLANAVEDDLLKKFDPKDYEDLGGGIVNGNQPLMIHLKACVRDLGDRSACCGPYDSMGQMTSGIVTAIHELNSSKDVGDYIANEIQAFANNVRKGVKYAMQYVASNADSDSWIAKKANFGAIMKTLMPTLQLAQILNQLSGGAETAGGIAKNFVSDMLSPIDVRTGTVLSKQQPR